MKTLSLSATGQRLARHQDRAGSPRRRGPQTDYQFQPQAEDVATAREVQAAASRADLRAFRKLSSDFLAEEAGHNYFVEMGVFAVVAGLIAWPLISLLIVLAQTARG